MNALYLEFSKSKAQGDRKQKSGKKLVNCLNSQRGLRNALTWQATDGNWQRNWFLLSLDIWRAVPSHLGIHQPPQRRHQHSGALDLPSSHFYLIRYLIRWYLLDILPWESHNRTSDVIKINGIFFSSEGVNALVFIITRQLTKVCTAEDFPLLSIVAFLPFFIYFKGPLFSTFCCVKGEKKAKNKLNWN